MNNIFLKNIPMPTVMGRRVHHRASRVLLGVVLMLCTAGLFPAQAQTASRSLHITWRDGSVLSLPVDSLLSIDFSDQPLSPLQQFTGRWQLVAAPMGSQTSGGIYSSRPDTIRFTASLSSEGDVHTLHCHADTLLMTTRGPLAADWLMRIEQGQEGYRIGWLLSSDVPVARQEGACYYLLTERIETQQLEAITLWTDWMPSVEVPFALPRNQELYLLACAGTPFDASAITEWLEIWASARLLKVSEQ